LCCDGAYVKRAAAIFRARVTLVHVFDLYDRDAVQLCVRPLAEVVEEQQGLARDKLHSFLNSEFPVEECPRVLLLGDAARQCPQSGALGRLRDLTYAVVRDAPCPVLSV